MRLDLITVICGSTTAKKKSQTLAGKGSAQPRFSQIGYIHIIYGSQGSSIVCTGGGVTLGTEDVLLLVLSRISRYSWHMAHR
jgi:hypothetical protein